MGDGPFATNGGLVTNGRRRHDPPKGLALAHGPCKWPTLLR